MTATTLVKAGSATEEKIAADVADDVGGLWGREAFVRR